MTTIQLPPLSPSAPVRTQGSRRATLSGGGGLRHTALGWRVRTPWTTPANGGSHGAAPPRNLGVRCGQRPSVHRLQRCRGPSGPRASGATATRHVRLGTTRATAGHWHHGRAPREGDAPNAHTWRAAAGEGPANAERSCSRRSPPVLVPGLRRLNTPEPERRSVLQGRRRGERVLSPLHIPSDRGWADGRRAIVPARENYSQGQG